MDSKKQLIDLIIAKSYREGDFTLSSGKKSSFYIDLKATTLSARGASLIGKLSLDLLIEKKILPQVKGVGGLTLGADPIATAISIESLSRDQKKEGFPAFIVRKEVKDHGTGKLIEGAENLQPGSSLLIVEDVSTTGRSAMLAVERVLECGYRVAAVLTVVDREEEARSFFSGRSIPFYSLATLSEIRSRYRA